MARQSWYGIRGGRSLRMEHFAALALLLAAMVWKYYDYDTLVGAVVLNGWDFRGLHAVRIQFAIDHLFSGGGLPGWYPGELFGTPFQANLHNFPWNPLRWPLLLMDPFIGYGVGVVLAGTLAGWFTYLYSRTLGLSFPGALLAGWSFAACTYFVSRVAAGHLPLLEAYMALPLLLWLAEKWVRLPSTASAAQYRWIAGGTALATLAMVLSGHPQLPFYAVLVMGVYLLARAPLRRSLALFPAVGFGAGLALFAWWPMLALIRRSTRVLELERAGNDVPLYPELALDFVYPLLSRMFAEAGSLPERLAQLPAAALWDSSVYTGVLAPLAVVAVVVALFRGAIEPLLFRPLVILLAVGVLAVVTALPFFHDLTSAGGMTLFRSPVRQVYLAAFPMALCLGVTFDWLWRRRSLRHGVWFGAAAMVLALVQVIDLERAGRPFVKTFVPATWGESEIDRWVEARQPERVAIDLEVVHRFHERFDDPGFFDSIMLSRPYQTLMALAGEAATRNVQYFDGSELSAPALSFIGVDTVVSRKLHPDLEPRARGREGNFFIYTVPNPAPRYAFFNQAAMTFHDQTAWLAQLVDLDEAILRSVSLRPGVAGLFPGTGEGLPQGMRLAAERPHPDRIELGFDAPEAGVVRILETYDPGWRAEVNGERTEILLANGFAMAVPVGPGRREIVLTYHTPGRVTGLVLSLVSLLGLGIWLAIGIPRFVPSPARLEPAPKA